MMSFVKNDYYVQAYKIYLKSSDQREANVRCLRNHIPKALQKLQIPQNRSKFNLLSIGAGDGCMDQEIVKIVKERYLNKDKHLEDFRILNTAVEPHPEMVKQYQTSIERRNKGRVSAAIEFKVKPMSFEEYAESNHDLNQYDMVHAMHSIYHMDSIESTMVHCYFNELGGKGLIACFLADQECIIYPIKATITKRGSEERDNTRSLTTASDIAAIAKKNNWKFERILCPYTIDVTGILGDNSDEGRFLIDWLTFVPGFYRSADQELVDDVLQLLKERAIKDDNGKLVIKAANELILICKS